MASAERERQVYESANKNLYDFILSNALYSEDEEIFGFFGVKTSFGEFKEKVVEVAKKLLSLGLKQGDRVLISLVSTPESIELMYACSYLGIVPVLADLRLSLNDMIELCEETSSKLAFISDFRACELLSISEVPCLDKLIIVSVCDGISQSLYFLQKTWYLLKFNPYFIKKHFTDKVWEWMDFLACDASGITIPEPASGDCEMLFTTSGTTGKRKHVILTSEQVNLEAYQHIVRFDFDPVKTTMSVMPMFTCYGFSISVHLPLLAGTKLILHPVYEAKSIPRVLLKYKPNFYAGVIGHWEELISYKKAHSEDFSYLKVLIFGGDSCSKDRLDMVNDFLSSHGCTTKLCEGYGMTEVTSGAVVQDPSDYVSSSVGRPLPLTEVCIVKPGTVTKLPVGEKGEVCIHTPCQTKGYFNNNSATDKLIKFHDDGKAWIHSGDLGWVDEDCNLYIDGRIKSMLVSSSGTKLFLPLLQAAASKLSGGKCVAVALPDSKKEYMRRIVLFITPKPGTRRVVRGRRLSTALRGEVPLFLIPDKIVYLKRFPLASSGKVDMQKLNAHAQRIISEKKHFFRRRLK